MSQKLQLTRKLRVEGLETRAMLAGDVKVVADLAGNLSIRGDLADNAIEISEVAPGEFEISNIDPVIPTTFNNGLAGPILVTGITGNVKVDLKQGNDVVQVIEGVNFPADLDIQTGHGNDTISLLGIAVIQVTVAGNLSVKSGQGDDIVDLFAVEVGGDAEVDTSDGNDIVTLFDPSTYLGDLTIRLGHGDDLLTVGSIAGFVSVFGNLKINASLGNDSVVFNNVIANTAQIDTSDGNDIVFILASAFNELETRLGHGDDIMDIRDSTVTGTADFNGSADIDLFIKINNTFGTLKTKGF